MTPEQIEEQRQVFEAWESERQSHRDKAKTALLDARCLLAPKRDMPKALRAEAVSLLDTVLRHWDEAMRDLP